MPRIQFGEGESRLRFALRGGGLGGISFIVPRFGRRCVCCSADAMGRTQDYDASTERIHAPPVPMPVCFACRDHALLNPSMGVYQACLLIVGGLALGLGISELGKHPEQAFIVGITVLGALLLLAGILWTAAAIRREQRARIPGHHPWLAFSIDGGRTVLATHNDELAVELLERNPSARLLPVPPSRRRWWRKDPELPEARALEAPRRTADDDEGARLAAYLAANPPAAPDDRDRGER